MRTIVARYRGTCCQTGRSFRPGDTIIVLSKGRYALASATPVEPIDPDLALAASIDPELAASDPESARHAGAYLRRSMNRGVSDIWYGYGGKEYYRNKRGLCEDAPCCGCCNA